MTEIEILKEQIKGLEKLLAIKDQIIAANQTTPGWHWHYHSPWQPYRQYWGVTSSGQSQQQQQQVVGQNMNTAGIQNGL